MIVLFCIDSIISMIVLSVLLSFVKIVTYKDILGTPLTYEDILGTPLTYEDILGTPSIISIVEFC